MKHDFRDIIGGDSVLYGIPSQPPKCCVCGKVPMLERFIDHEGWLRVKFIGIDECPGGKDDT